LGAERLPTLVLLNGSAGFYMLMLMTAQGLQNKREAEQNGTKPDKIAQDSFSCQLYDESRVTSMMIFFLNKYSLSQSTVKALSTLHQP
jgi:hypothetical protein